MIVDQYGDPIASRLVAGADRFARQRPYWRVLTQDFEDDVPDSDRLTLMSASRRLYANDGVVKGAIDQMAMHAVGRAWNPHYNGDDEEWGKVSQAWLTEEWFGVCDVRGYNFDFKTNLYNDSVAMDVDGDGAIILTETDKGYPQTQHIRAHRIGCRNSAEDGEVVKNGPLKGYKICQGIIHDELNRLVGVRVLGDEPTEDRDIVTSDVIFFMNAVFHDQFRGLPSFSHAINELRDAWQAHQYEQQSHQAISSISLIETNANGGLDPNDPGVVLGTQGTNNETFAVQTMAGGQVKYFKAGAGCKIEELGTHKPGPEWESFQDRIFRKALVGMCWPYSLTWRSEKLSGPAERSEIEKARGVIADRQDVLDRVAKRQIFYALAKAAKLKIIPPMPKDWWKWTFTVPPKFSIDNGRDAQSRREDHLIGHRNLKGILGEVGIDYEAHRRERKQEVIDRLTDAAEIQKKFGDIPLGTILSMLYQQTASASVGGGMNGTTLEDAVAGAIDNTVN